MITHSQRRQINRQGERFASEATRRLRDTDIETVGKDGIAAAALVMIEAALDVKFDVGSAARVTGVILGALDYAEHVRRRSVQ